MRIHSEYKCINRLVSHIPKLGDASKIPAGDAVVFQWRCIIFFRDAYPPHSHPHLSRKIWSHLQIAGYATLVNKSLKKCFVRYQIFLIKNRFFGCTHINKKTQRETADYKNIMRLQSYRFQMYNYHSSSSSDLFKPTCTEFSNINRRKKTAYLFVVCRIDRQTNFRMKCTLDIEQDDKLEQESN